jgi:hypothetical protein
MTVANSQGAPDEQSRYRIEDWDQLGGLVDRLYAADDPSTYRVYVFRGHASTYLTLCPSIAREGRTRACTPDQLLRLEARLDEEAERHRHLHGAEPPALVNLLHSKLYNWAMMRHHGGPSRVLDWTASPFVALYFAVRDHYEDDGELWWVDHREVDRIRPQRLPPIPESEPFDAAAQRNRLFFVPVPFPAKRAAAQQGMLSVCEDITADHAMVLGKYLGPPQAWPRTEEQTGSLIFGRAVVAKERKREFLRRLRSMNIGGKTLFPDLEGLGMSGQDIMRGNPLTRSDPYQFKDHF